MHRLIAILLAATVTCLAQDVPRMVEIAESHATAGKLMGSSLVARDGEILLERSFGSANLEWSIPNTADTKFRIGSVTKQFTAAAVLLLEERGKLNIHDPVSKHVPDAPDAWTEVTIFHLLTHTSGIPSFTNWPEYASWKLVSTPVKETVARFRDKPLEFPPGEDFRYSNSGYVLLGYLIERVSGQSYSEFLQQNIFTPLGMKDSGYDSDTALITRRASGYAPTPEGPANAAFIDMSVPHAAGGLYSTTRDLLRWHQGLFGGQLLSPDSLEKMMKPHRNDYALGLAVRAIDGRTVVEHGGGIEGFNAQLAYYPESRVTVVALANLNGSAPAELARQLGALAHGGDVTLISERRAIDVPLEVLQSYVGTYQLTPQIENVIRIVDGQLTTQLTGQSMLPLFAETETVFFLKIVDAQVEFMKNDEGDVEHLILQQGGNTLKAPRVSAGGEE